MAIASLPRSRCVLCRYSQELSSEGWQGLRTRLISLHARFYGAVLLILLVSITFYSRCGAAEWSPYSILVG